MLFFFSLQFTKILNTAFALETFIFKKISFVRCRSAEGSHQQYLNVNVVDCPPPPQDILQANLNNFLWEHIPFMRCIQVQLDCSSKKDRYYKNHSFIIYFAYWDKRKSFRCYRNRRARPIFYSKKVFKQVLSCVEDFLALIGILQMPR